MLRAPYKLNTWNIWTLEEEEQLLSGIISYGYGNWDKIGRRLGKDPHDCEKHYLYRFITDPEEDELKEILSLFRRQKDLCSSNCNLSLGYEPDNFTNNHSVANVLNNAKDINLHDYLWKTLINKDTSSLSVLKKENLIGVSHHLLNGYNPNRSEFEIDFDNKAESIFLTLNEDNDASDFEDSDDESLHKELKCALVNSYNFRLSERIRRKEIIRKHALLDRAKHFSVIQRYENVLNGRMQLIALLSCMRFVSGPEIDFLLEQMRFQRDLKVRINRLSAYRKLGIKHFDTITLYEKLYRKRMKHKHELEMNASSISLGIKYHKRTSAPLDIHNLPCYTDLEDEEKELCSTARIVPETYLSFKNLMIQECQKLDGLKLQIARQLFKIDVNKTRKIYDHLITKKLIWLPHVK